jgi:hypothetical protein
MPCLSQEARNSGGSGAKMNFNKIGYGSYENEEFWITDVRMMHEGDPDAIAQLGKNGWAYGKHGEIWGTVKTLKEAKAILGTCVAA